MTVSQPFARHLYVMPKPAGAACNLHCRYCYYLEKACLYRDSRGENMTEETLETFIRQYIQSQTGEDILFVWHGGEPMLRPLSFYRKALRLQQYYGRGRRISNAIQTNGTLINDEWARFLRQHGFLVGVSIDGPRAFHDAYRLSAGGKPSFDRVMRGIRLLNQYQVDWNAMAVVNNLNGSHPLEFYHFFKEIGCHYIQFTPIVERLQRHEDGRTLADINDHGCEVASWSVSPRQWGDFCCAIYDEWVRHDVGSYFVQLFDATLSNWAGVEPGVCTLSKSCGHAAAMEFNGDLYSCDHFVFPEYKLGNIHHQTLYEMMNSEQQKQFAQTKMALPERCRKCQWEFACHGECPKNRFLDGGVNYLCEGYRRFFAHVEKGMDFMKRELLNGRPPANVMDIL